VARFRTGSHTRVICHADVYSADLEVKKRLEIEERAKSIKSVVEEPDIYQVQSGSNPDVFYRVDLDAYDCSCLSFPAICFCQRICAVQNKFPEIYKVLPASLLAIHAHDTTFEPNGNTSDIGSYPPPDSETQPQRLDETTTLIQKLSSPTIYLQANPSCGSESSQIYTAVSMSFLRNSKHRIRFSQLRRRLHQTKIRGPKRRQ
jgi:hypothetical protein